MKIMKYLESVGDSLIFKGNKVVIKIPRRYENYDLLKMSNDIQTLGIFSIDVNDGELTGGIYLPSILTMEPSKTHTISTEEQDFLVAEFQKGDKFIVDVNLLRQPRITYQMFVEFIALGNVPSFLSYKDSAAMFDLAKKVCDADLRIDHSTFEMIIAHLSRDPNNLNTKYRHTDMKQKPSFIGLRSVTYGTDSTTANLIGAYMADGTNAAIVNPSEQRSDLEDLLRT